jgi:WD40 repeat protein
LLRRATVRLRDPRDPARWGTGFFVANDVLLTCWHVWRDGSDQWVLVEQPPLPEDLDLEEEQQRNPSHGRRTLTLGKATLLEQGETWDLALLRFTPTDQVTGADGKRFEPVVLPLVEEDPSPGAQLLSTAFPRDAEGWHDATYQAAGRSTPSGQQREFLRFKADGVVPGFSGSPLLILASGLVCGVIARNDLPGGASDGGLAVPMTAFCRAFPINAGALLERNAAERNPGLSTIRRPLGRSDWSWPLPLDFAPFRTFRREGFVGRHWLFEEIRDWLGAADNRAGRPWALLIEADYGVGKSALLAELIDRQVAGIPVVAQHFCQFDALATLAPGRFVSSIAAQLAAALPAYRAAIEAEDAADLRRLLDAPDADPIGVFDQAVLAPLAGIPSPDGPRLLVVDALDEALEHRPSTERAAAVTIVGLLGQRALRFPPWLLLLATSRPMPAVLQPLRQAFRLHSLNAEEARNLADIETYAAARCQRPPLAARLAAAGLGASEVAIRLRTLSGGKFLYVAFVLNDLEFGALPLRDRHDLDALPSGMDAFYLQAFERRFPTEATYAEVRDLLAVHCVQRDPLSRRELAAILSCSEARLINQQKDLHDLLRLSKNDPAYRPKEFLASFNHPSLNRWLTATDEHSGYPRAGRFCIDTNPAEAAIHSWALAEVETKQAHRSPYLVRHMASHLTVEEQPDVIARLLGEFSWLEARLQLAGIFALLDDFVIASPSPWSSQLERALRQGSHVLSSNGAWNCHEQLASQLLARMADSDSQVRRLREEAVAKVNEAGGALPLVASLTADNALSQILLVSSGVNTLVALPDGRLASGHRDFTIRLWELDSGLCSAVLKANSSKSEIGGDSGVSTLAILPDGRLASGSFDYSIFDDGCEICLWDLELGISPVIFKHAKSAKRLVVLQDGRLCFAPRYIDKSIYVLDPRTGDCAAIFKGHQNSVMDLAVLPNGLLASGSLDKTIRIWNPTNHNCYTILQLHSEVLSLAILPDGRLAAGCVDGTIHLIDSVSRACLTRLKINLGEIVSLVSISDGLLAAGDLWGRISIVNSLNGECRYLSGHQGSVSCLVALQDGRLVSGSGGILRTDYTIRIWDLACNLNSSTIDDHLLNNVVLTFLHDGRMVCGDREGTIRLFDMKTKNAAITIENHSHILALTVLLDGRFASSSKDKTIRIWDPTSAQCAMAIDMHQASATALVALPDGNIGAGLSDGTICLFNPSTGDLLASHRNINREITALAVLPCGHIVSASDNSRHKHIFDDVISTISIWNPVTDRYFTLDERYRSTVRSLACLHDGRLASSSDDEVIRLWKPMTGECSTVFTGHQSPVNTMTVLSEGSLISGSGGRGGDNSIRIWDPACLDGAPAVLFIADAAITALVAHPTAPMLVASDYSGRLHWLWLPKAR